MLCEDLERYGQHMSTTEPTKLSRNDARYLARFCRRTSGSQEMLASWARRPSDSVVLARQVTADLKWPPIARGN